MSDTDEEMLDMLRYFWEQKGDIERWVGFDRERLLHSFPEIIKAWDDYKASKRMVGAVLRGADEGEA